jgi:hypothetical protein
MRLSSAFRPALALAVALIGGTLASQPAAAFDPMARTIGWNGYGHRHGHWHHHHPPPHVHVPPPRYIYVPPPVVYHRPPCWRLPPWHPASCAPPPHHHRHW